MEWDIRDTAGVHPIMAAVLWLGTIWAIIMVIGMVIMVVAIPIMVVITEEAMVVVIILSTRVSQPIIMVQGVVVQEEQQLELLQQDHLAQESENQVMMDILAEADAALHLEGVILQ
jgi:hypothetical protein